MKGLQRLLAIRELSKKNNQWIHKDLFRILRHDDIWITAYDNIKKNQKISYKSNNKRLRLSSFNRLLKTRPGKSSMDVTSLNGGQVAVYNSSGIDRIFIKKIKKLKNEVLNESYQFTSIKKVRISKDVTSISPGSACTKRGSIPRPPLNDQIVSEIIKMILEAIFEPIFDEKSFGFRPERGVHNALEYVEKRFRGVDWIIKEDFLISESTSSCNENKASILPQNCSDINYTKLCQFLENRIDDVRFLNLIRKSLRSNKLDEATFSYSNLGVPQKSIILPIFINIYYHELDVWVQQKANKFYHDRSASYNKLNCSEISYQTTKTQVEKLTKLDKNSEKYKNLVKQIKTLKNQKWQISNLKKKRVQFEYVRYADAWMIGVGGEYSLALNLKTEIDDFLKKHNKQKTKITNLRKGRVTFLGYNIFLPKNTIFKKNCKEHKARYFHPRLRFDVPVDQITKLMMDRGYVTRNFHRLRPISKSNYTPLEDDIIVKNFRTVWLELANYYSGCTNFNRLQYIHNLFHISCAMTLAHRHRSSSRKIFKKYGKYLTIQKPPRDKKMTFIKFPYRSTWSIIHRHWKTNYNFKLNFI